MFPNARFEAFRFERAEALPMCRPAATIPVELRVVALNVVANTLPVTCKFAVGAVVPIPTDPMPTRFLDA
jgi:hypothetical protein